LETGKPYGFTELPAGARRLIDQQWAIDWLNRIDPYSAVLVSTHRTGLVQGRYQTIVHPEARYMNQVPAAASEFVTHNESWQKEQLATLPDEHPDGMWTNYRLLQVWDLL